MFYINDINRIGDMKQVRVFFILFNIVVPENLFIEGRRWNKTYHKRGPGRDPCPL